MDPLTRLLRNLSHFHQPVTLEEQLVKLINLNIVHNNVRQFLVDHPRLLSEEAIKVLKVWEEEAISDGEEEAANAMVKYRNLLQIIWPICIEAPLSIPSNRKSYPELVETFRKVGISSTNELVERAKMKSDLRPKLTQIALQHLSQVDWGILLLLVTTIVDDDIFELVKVLPFLLEYETDLSLNTLTEWLYQSKKWPHLQNALVESHNYLKSLRNEIGAENTTLGKPHIEQLVDHYLEAQSWKETWEIINDQSEQLLSEDALIEIESSISSAHYQFTIDGSENSEPLSWNAMHLEILERCKEVGIEAASNSKPISTLPLELWALAGMLRVANPSIRSWGGFNETWERNPQQINFLAKSLQALLTDTGIPNEGAFTKSLLEIPSTPEEKETLRRLTLVQFILRGQPSSFLKFIAEEPILLEEETTKILVLLLNRAQETEQLTSAAAVWGLWGLVNSPYRSEFIEILGMIGAEKLDEVFSTGSHLAMLVGGLALVVKCDTDKARFELAESYPILVSDKMTELINIVTPYLNLVSKELYEKLNQSFVFIRRAADIGSFAAFAESDLRETEPNLSPMVLALTIFLSAETPEQMVNILDNYPDIPADEMLIGISEYISTLQEKVDIDEVERTKQFYAEVLVIRRNKREKASSFQRQIPDLPGGPQAANLILTLEVRLLADLWTPVSRIDLTDTFFRILELWQKEVMEKFGHHASEPLHKVALQTKEWLYQFGDTLPEHNQGLASALLRLLTTEEPSRQLELMESNPQLLEKAAEDVLRDWLVTTQSPSHRDISNRILDLIDLLTQSRKLSPRAALMIRTDAVRPETIERVTAALGIQGVDTLTDLFEIILNMPDKQSGELFRNLFTFLNETASNDITASQARRLRLEYLMHFELMPALKAGSEAAIKLLKEEPLLTEPDALEYIRLNGPPQLVELYQTLVKLCTDSLMIAKLQDTVTEEQILEQARLEFLLEKHLAATWRERVHLVKEYPELISDTALFIADILEKRHLKNVADNTQVTEADYEAARQGWAEAKAFLKRCREVTPEIALEEKFGTSPYDGGGYLSDYRDLLINIPAGLMKKLNSSKDNPEVLRDLASSEDLNIRDRATIYAKMGLDYKVLFEINGQRNNLNEAIEAYRNSLQLTEPDTPEQADRLKWLANCLVHKFEIFGDSSQDLEEAILAFRKALSIPHLDTFLRAQVLGHLGRALITRCEAFVKIADLEEAIKLLNEAIKITPHGTQDWIGWHINLGAAWSLHFQIHQTPQSLERACQVCENVLSVAEVGSNLWQTLKGNLANLYSSQAGVYSSSKFSDKAIEVLQELINFSSVDGDLAGVYSSLGTTFLERFELSLQKSDINQAIEAHRTAANLIEHGSLNWITEMNRLASVHKMRGEYFRNKKDLQQAVTIYEEILTTSLISSWPRVIYVTAENLGNLYARQGAFSSARQAYAKAIDAVEVMRKSTPVLEEKIHYSKEHRLLYKRQVSCCLNTEDTTAAFEYAVAAKGRAFADMLATAPFQIDNPDPKLQTLLTEASNIQARLQHLRGLVTGEVLPRQKIAGQATTIDTDKLSSEIDTLQSREADIWQQIRYEYPQYAATQSAPTLKTQQAQELARTLNATLLEFYLDAGGWGVFVISAKNIWHIRLADSDPPWEKWGLTIFRKYGDGSGFYTTLKELYLFFFAPLEAHLPPIGSKLIIAPYGLMNVFPLPAVLKPDGHHLLDDFTVAMSPSLGVLDLVVGKSQPRGHSGLLTVEHPGRAGSRHYLQYVGVETATISTFFDDAVCLQGEHATPDTIIKQAPQQTIIHLACHGIYDWQQPDASGLMLPDGAWLTIPDVFNRLRLPNSSLVVLSACDVGREHIGPGEEHSSLVRAFMYAGAPGVIASLWSVADLSTMLLMTRFYQELCKGGDNASGLSPASALCRAQIWLRDASRNEIISYLEGFKRQFADSGENPKAHQINVGIARVKKLDDPPFAHPYFWAAFQAVGDVL